jgi:hypothetical protein
MLVVPALYVSTLATIISSYISMQALPLSYQKTLLAVPRVIIY